VGIASWLCPVVKIGKIDGTKNNGLDFPNLLDIRFGETLDFKPMMEMIHDLLQTLTCQTLT
jgi:hypothetical protein